MLKFYAVKDREDGFAPLIITIVIVTVLSLMTVGFVQLMRSNQYNALNKQLNNDAYYAAESGVNDAVEAIHAGYNGAKKTCGPVISTPQVQGSKYLSDNQVNGSQDVYSCLLINPTPPTLLYSSVDTNSPTVAIMTGEDPNSGSVTKIGYLMFSWQPSTGGSSSYSFASKDWLNYGSGPYLPKENLWSAKNLISGNTEPIIGVLRVALTPVIGATSSSGAIPSDTSATYTGFLYPVGGNGKPESAPDYDQKTIGADSGEVVSGNCANNNSQPEACNVIIDVRKADTNSFVMELRSIYSANTVTVTAYNDSGPTADNSLLIKNAQTLVDSTGDDKGVLKRIQVRVPNLNYTGMPAYDISSKLSICKDLSVFPTNKNTGNKGQAISSCGL